MISSPLIGIGLRHPHYQQVIEERPTVGWFEVHSENFFDEGGPAIDFLMKVRSSYPLSLHGVGLSLGSAEGVQENHLARLKSLIDKTNPFMISEHLSWGKIGKTYFHDLLPLPYTEETLKVFCDNVQRTQDYIKRQILIENPSSYLEFKDSHLTEVEFLIKMTEITGAFLLLDVNNVFVSCWNHNRDPVEYIQSIPQSVVKEIHIAGHSLKEIGPGKIIRIDTHDDFVSPEVWELYAIAIQRFGVCPTLLEWDAKLPSLAELIREASKANYYLSQGEKSYAIA